MVEHAAKAWSISRADLRDAADELSFDPACTRWRLVATPFDSSRNSEATGSL